MPTLISPGVSVTVTDESFFIPAAAPTVPLIFIATAEEKTRPDGVTLAEGTAEYNVVRTVTSLKQSTELYGVPRFLRDSNDDPHHGDARNEYGLAALNAFLSVGNLAYVIRANVNLDDDILSLRSLWDRKMSAASTILSNSVVEYINAYNIQNNLIPASPGYKTTVNKTEYMSLATEATRDIFEMYSFKNIKKTSPQNLSPAPVPIIAAKQSFAITSIGGTSNFVISGNKTAIFKTGVPFDVATGANAGSYIVLSNSTYNSGTNETVITVSGTLTSTVAPNHGNITINSFVASGVNLTANFTSGFNFTVIGSSTGNGTYSVQSSSYDGTNTTIVVNQNIPTPGSLLGSISYTLANVVISDDFLSDFTTLPKEIYANGYDQAPTGTFIGLTGMVEAWNANLEGTTVPGELNAFEAASLLQEAADDFKYTQEFALDTGLGSNDADRRVAITTALAEVILNNSEIRSEAMEYNLILTPGYHELVDEMLTLNLAIDEEAFIIADTPMNLDPQACFGVSGWSSSTARRNSSHVAYYYPHVSMSNLDGRVILAPASGIALRTYAYNDNVAYLWFAPAGIRRGPIVGIDNLGYAKGTLGSATEFGEVHVNLGQRNEMYGYTAQGALNPLVFFPGRGFLVWGQKTSTQSTASAMDRVNVSRLVKYIKRALRKGALPFVFEPNDEITRNSLKSVVDGLLGDLIVKRGLYDFATICDSSNNTPDRIDRNELWLDVAIKPVKAAEFIYIPIRIVATGASI